MWPFTPAFWLTLVLTSLTTLRLVPGSQTAVNAHPQSRAEPRHRPRRTRSRQTTRTYETSGGAAPPPPSTPATLRHSRTRFNAGDFTAERTAPAIAPSDRICPSCGHSKNDTNPVCRHCVTPRYTPRPRRSPLHSQSAAFAASRFEAAAEAAGGDTDAAPRARRSRDPYFAQTKPAFPYDFTRTNSDIRICLPPN